MQEQHEFTPDNLQQDHNKVNPNFDLSQIIGAQDIINEAERVEKESIEGSVSDNLKTVLSTSEKLKELKANDIRFSEPVLKQGDNAVIFPHTINVIQGQAGVHKSRLAEYICSAFLKLHNCNNQLLGFKRTNFDATHTVVYVDTERNQSEQLPYALQSIQLKAGYDKAAHPHNFKYVSLLQISRKDRFSTLNEYLNHLRKSTNSPLFIVLDVSTDCIEDFNRTDKSMELIDLMNVAINEHNVIFLCLIHENPKSDKARGHFGTELMNKASTAMQVGFEKDAGQNDTDIIRVKYMKCRSTAKYTPFHIKYCNEEKGLILADQKEVAGVMNGRKQKAIVEDMIDMIEVYLGDGTTLTRTELIDKLKKDFGAQQRTIEQRLKEITDSEIEIYNEQGQSCKLKKETKEKILYYSLAPIDSI